MLPKHLRLPLRKSGTFFATAQRVSHPWFTCWYRHDDSHFQASIIVSKKVSLLAVDRNQLKRRVRTILQRVTPPNGLKTVFVMKRASLSVSVDELATAVQKTLIQISHENNHHRPA